MPKRSSIYGTTVVLPNKPFPKATFRVIVEAFVEAWRLLREDPKDGFKLDGATEDSITLELRDRLMNEVLDNPKFPAFNSANFSVCREAKFESYNRSSPDKMPDLYVNVIRDCRLGLRSADGLFVECKPVGRATPAGKDYCDKGIIRFVAGEYAWAMPHALMIGYAATGYTIPKKLKAAIDKRKVDLKTDGTVTKCRGGNLGRHTQHLHETTHRRGFIYVQTKAAAPEIVIQHLWLNRD